MAYGWYSNRTRGYRKKHGLLAPGAPIRCEEADSDKGPLAARRAWARLIAKVYEVNPLVCPRCGSEMKVVAVIDQEDAVYKILKHLGLLAPEESRAPPKTGPPTAFASPPAQAPDLFNSTAPPPRAHTSELPAWECPEAPGPDFASQRDDDPEEGFDLSAEAPGAEADDRGDGPDESSGVA